MADGVYLTCFAEVILTRAGYGQFSGLWVRLLCLWYDVPGWEGTAHRDEADAFFEIAKADGLKFHALTYQELIIRMCKDYGKEHVHYLKYITGLFGNEVGTARRRYGEYVRQGLARGRRPELVGGGLLRSVGGWKGLKDLGDAGTRVKGDERILGDTDFVTSVLEAGQEQMERKYRYKARGYDLAWLVERVGKLLEMTPEEVLRKGKYPEAVIARSVLCYFAVRELGLSTVDLARRLRLSQPAVSQSVQRGEKIASEKKLNIVSNQ